MRCSSPAEKTALHDVCVVCVPCPHSVRQRQKEEEEYGTEDLIVNIMYTIVSPVVLGHWYGYLGNLNNIYFCIYCPGRENLVGGGKREEGLGKRECLFFFFNSVIETESYTRLTTYHPHLTIAVSVKDNRFEINLFTWYYCI